MRLCRAIHLLIIQVLLYTAFEALADTNVLQQSQFLIDPSATNVCDFVVYKNLTGGVVSASSVPTQITSRVATYCLIRIPALQIQNEAATNYLPSVVDMPNLPIPQGSFGLGTLNAESTNSSPNQAWVPALPVHNDIITSSNLANVAYLELVDRLAQFLELKTGLLSSGALIYGTDGNWVTNYTPSYTIELSVRP